MTKYATAQEWLVEYLADFLKVKGPEALLNEFYFFIRASKVDDDTIQDMYESTMDMDGYFEEDSMDMDEYFEED